MRLDLTVTITAVLAICAIISPVITTIINNHHQKKMAEAEQARERFNNETLHKREIFEAYLENAGRSIKYNDPIAAKDYGASYFRALLFAPETIREDMRNADLLINANDYTLASKKLEIIAAKLNEWLQVQ